jgi:hypothetical protein
MDLAALGRLVLIVAVALFVIGLLFIGISKLTGGRGWLPGDIVYRRDGVTIYFPIVTAILISIVLSLILSFVLWLINRGR